VLILTQLLYLVKYLIFLLQNPVAQKNVGVFFSNISEIKVGFGGPNLFFSSLMVWVIDNPTS